MFKHIAIFSTLVLITILSIEADAQKRPSTMKNATPHIAKGEFEVKIVPQPAEDNIGDTMIGRLALDKKLTGGLSGVSKGQMLGSQRETEPGRGGYVAMERFVGTLDGKKGSFILQHVGTMDSTGYLMDIAVVPGSGG